MPIFGPLATTLSGMLAAGLGRLVESIWLSGSSPAARSAKLRDVFPSATPATIAEAYSFVAAAHQAAGRLERGQRPTLPTSWGSGPPSIDPTPTYDLLITLTNPVTGETGKIRYTVRAESPLSLADLQDIAEAVARKQGKDAYYWGPGRSAPATPQVSDLQIFGAYIA